MSCWMTSSRDWVIRILPQWAEPSTPGSTVARRARPPSGAGGDGGRTRGGAPREPAGWGWITARGRAGRLTHPWPDGRSRSVAGPPFRLGRTLGLAVDRNGRVRLDGRMIRAESGPTRAEALTATRSGEHRRPGGEGELEGGRGQRRIEVQHSHLGAPGLRAADRLDEAD